MSKLLLDTHVLLWSLLEPERIPEEARKVLDDPQHELWLSPMSTWEVMVLAERGRIELELPPRDFMEAVFETIPLREAPLNHRVAMESRALALPHQDPADRFIAASAIVYGLTLVTADRRLIDAAQAYDTLPLL